MVFACAVLLVYLGLPFGMHRAQEAGVRSAIDEVKLLRVACMHARDEAIAMQVPCLHVLCLVTGCRTAFITVCQHMCFKRCTWKLCSCCCCKSGRDRYTDVQDHTFILSGRHAMQVVTIIADGEGPEDSGYPSHLRSKGHAQSLAIQILKLEEKLQHAVQNLQMQIDRGGRAVEERASESDAVQAQAQLRA